ncbi:MAG: vitamin B12-dependent ribonucleotide reductase [Pseudomonadota bacterium]
MDGSFNSNGGNGHKASPSIFADLFAADTAASAPSDRKTRKKSQSSSTFNFLRERVFATDGTHPYDEHEWEDRDILIQNESGEAVFHQADAGFPTAWTQMACTVVASKYFRVLATTGVKESDLRQLVDRVVDTVTRWGLEDGYLANMDEGKVFSDELKWLVVNQHLSFNSPVWFNVGIEEKPQCSACFINSVEDRMGSILDLAKTEGMLFKYGSGSGVNLSPLRSRRENLSGGGNASGPVSFMRGLDAFAGVIKSGGTNRRAAKMVVLDVGHPDIMEFIRCKATEEEKARKLIDVGYSGGLDGEAYKSVFFQNANNSVRVTDAFMRKVIEDGDWVTRFVSTGEVADTMRARDVLRALCEATHYCGDPGLQFHDIINKWHTCPNSGPITASNPCSEFMFLNDTACNLASLNLMRFVEDGKFNTEKFEVAARVTILAQEILVDRSSYPTTQIQEMSHLYRPLGLGFANLGALLMSFGLPYDSEGGRSMAGAIAALMTGAAYRTSAEIAKHMGSFDRYPENREPMLHVMRMHQDALERIGPFPEPEILEAARTAWDHAVRLGGRYGYRNAQATVLAPTGTIGFMMDCDTTGVEPDIALVKFKKLVGGGLMKIVNGTVPKSLGRLGYNAEQVQEILDYIENTGTIEGAPYLEEDHLPIFDCAFAPANGDRFIHYMGHIKMLAAVQRFISGAISKTVNVPRNTSVEEIQNTYLESWKLGLKAVAVYRDGSKGVQVLSTSKDDTSAKATAVSGGEVGKRPARTKLPDERVAVTHKFSISGHEGYITVGMYVDGTPGEIFIVMAKQGSTVSGLMDAYATSISLALQYGVPLHVLVDKFTHQRFEPSGFTTNPDIPIAKSIVDYIFRWLSAKFIDGKANAARIAAAAHDPGDMARSAEEARAEDRAFSNARTETTSEFEQVGAASKMVYLFQEDAPACHNCGDIMVRNGSCYRCPTCGETSGCS